LAGRDVLHGRLALFCGQPEVFEIGELPGKHLRSGADVAFEERTVAIEEKNRPIHVSIVADRSSSMTVTHPTECLDRHLRYMVRTPRWIGASNDNGRVDVREL
jgi:hypothetical protein